jgi:hypothetical protein
MMWSKLKQLTEDKFANSVKDRVDFFQPDITNLIARQAVGTFYRRQFMECTQAF